MAMQLASLIRGVPIPDIKALLSAAQRLAGSWWQASAHRRAVFGAWWRGEDPPSPPAVEPAADPAPVTGWRAHVHAVWTRIEPVRRRFWAWWNGEAIEVAAVPAPEAPPPPPAPAVASSEAAETPPEPDTWSEQRAKMVQWLWGEGFDFPGGTDFILDLVRPLGLRGEHSMLDIGCGVGAATRAVATSLGPWITGLESSPALVKAGMEASERAGLAKKAPIQQFSLLKPELPSRRYDAIMSRLVLGAVPDHKQFVLALDKHLKPGGQLLFTEQVLSGAAGDPAVLEGWRAIEDRTTHPVSLELITKGLTALRYDVRIAEDMSSALRALVVRAWERVASDLQPGMFSADDIDHLNREMELWHRRVAAYDSGALKFVRVLAIKRAA